MMLLCTIKKNKSWIIHKEKVALAFIFKWWIC